MEKTGFATQCRAVQNAQEIEGLFILKPTTILLSLQPYIFNPFGIQPTRMQL